MLNTADVYAEAKRKQWKIDMAIYLKFLMLSATGWTLGQNQNHTSQEPNRL